MEAVGLAVGIAGLVGLFNTCIDIARRIESWKDHGDEWAKQAVLFEAERLRLERWGKAVHLRPKAVGDPNITHEAFNDARTQVVVKELLKLIKAVCSETASSFLPGPSAKIHRQSIPSTDLDFLPSKPLVSKRDRLKWALWSEGKLVAQVEQLRLLIYKLHEIVPPIEPVASNVSDSTHNTNGLLIEVRRGLHSIKSSGEAELKRTLHRWLLEQSTTTDIFDDALRKKIDRSCEWLFIRPEFNLWASPEFHQDEAKVLWLHGPAGFGKTILCATIVEHMPSIVTHGPIAHFFFSSDLEYRGDPYVAIRSWISQLIPHPAAFNTIFDCWHDDYEPNATRKKITELFADLIRRIPGCTFIMDGLDECAFQAQDNAEDIMSQFFEDLQKYLAGSTARLLITSRNEPEIRNGVRSGKDWTLWEYEISVEDVESDLRLYSRSIVNRRLANKTESVKDEISQYLANRSNGQFQWVKMLEQCLSKGKNTAYLKKAISETPTGLDRLYDRNWDKIHSYGDTEKNRAIWLLRWAAFAYRPLEVREITEALLIDQSTGKLDIDAMPDEIDEYFIDSEILGICGSLIEVRGSPAPLDCRFRKVHVAHFSVKEYLIKRLKEDGNPSSGERLYHTYLARMCIRYVNHPIVWQDHDPQSQTSFPKAFRSYAAWHWYIHLNSGNLEDRELLHELGKLLHDGNPVMQRWALELATDNSLRWRSEDIGQLSPFYYGAALQLRTPTFYSQRSGKIDPNERNSLGVTCLMQICFLGNAEFARDLVLRGADVTLTDKQGTSGLHLAVWFGHNDVASVLLDNGANTNAVDHEGWTPLHYASMSNSPGATLLLLEAGAHHSPKTDCGDTPCSLAALYDCYEVTNILLDNGANPNPEVNAVETEIAPLTTAVENGNYRVAKLLLDRGARGQASALCFAARAGHIEMISLLLDHGVGIDSIYQGQTPLLSAVANGQDRAATLLMNKGANPNIAMDGGVTALMFLASRTDADALIQQLLDHQADVNAADDYGNTVLMVAAKFGHFKIVKYLLSRAARIDAMNRDGYSPLWFAIAFGHTEVTQLLFDNAAVEETRFIRGGTPLKWATQFGHIEIMKLLLDRHADIEAVDKFGATPLLSAARSGRCEAVRLLLDRGANINAINNAGATALAFASEGWYEEQSSNRDKNKRNSPVGDKEENTSSDRTNDLGRMQTITLLLERSNLTLNMEDNEGRDSLFRACAWGQDKLVPLLISHGTHVNKRDRYGATPLIAAVRNGHEQVAMALLRIDHIEIDAQDAQRLDAMDWAYKTGNARILQLLHDYAVGKGLKVPHKHDVIEKEQPRLNARTRFCDICTRPITDKSWYHCESCNGGDFDICQECSIASLKCHDASHEWVTEPGDDEDGVEDEEEYEGDGVECEDDNYGGSLGDRPGAEI